LHVVSREDHSANFACVHTLNVHAVGVRRRVGGAECGTYVTAHEGKDDAVTGGHAPCWDRYLEGRSVVAGACLRPQVLHKRDAGARLGCGEAEQEGERQRRYGAAGRILGLRSRGWWSAGCTTHRVSSAHRKRGQQFFGQTIPATSGGRRGETAPLSPRGPRGA